MRTKVCSSDEAVKRADCLELYCLTICVGFERGKRKCISRPLYNGKSRRQKLRKWERTDMHSDAGVEDIMRFIFHFSIV
jgi:hypothetical protein